MPTALNVIICAVGATLFWTCLGLAIARRLVDHSLALPIAPALGWAVHSAAALPILMLVGFSAATVLILAVAALVVSLASLFAGALSHKNGESTNVPIWAYIGAALLALGPAAAIMPEVGLDGIAFAPPIFDHSKIAIIDEIARLGLPPGNPFFGEAGEPASRLAYYYLWHFSAAELAKMTGASGWEADIAMTWFTAFASIMLMAGLANWFCGRAAAVLWVLLLNAALSLRFILDSVFDAEKLARLLAPATGFGGWLFQAAWVPQHIASASTIILALFFFAQLAFRPGALLFSTFVLLAAAAYESSTWIGGVLFPVAGVMTGLMLLIALPPQQRVRFATLCAGAAVLAICLASPLLYDQFLATSMRAGGSPIALHPFEVLGPAFPWGLRRLLDLPAFWLVLLPLELPAVYVTGIIAAWGYLRLPDLDDARRRAATGFVLLTAASLCGSWLFISTIGENNDLGWRVVLPGAMVLTIFAAVGLSHWIAVRAWAAASAAIGAWLLGLPGGIARVHENVIGSLHADGELFARTPVMWAAVRGHAASDERIANNPLFLQNVTPWPVNLSWALLSNRRSCFAGRELTLAYTSLPRDRREQIDAQFIRIFAGDASSEDMRDLASRYHCHVVVLTAQDKAWSRDPFSTSPLYRLAESDDRWRIYKVVSDPAGAKPP